MTFSDRQLENWRRYERVREGGRFNMFDSRARRLTGLSEEDYTFCMANYEALLHANETQQAGKPGDKPEVQ